MNLLQESLYWLTSGLLIPCIAFLLFMFIQSMMAIGRQILIGQKHHNSVAQLTEQLRKNTEAKSENITFSDNSLQLSCIDSVKQLIGLKDVSYGTYLITQFEAQTDKLISRYSNLAKLGPITGLMGTLIPMGPALQGLAQGNIEQLASQMQIAFTTTVIGLIIGAIGFILYQINKRQAIKEIALLDYLLDVKVIEQ